MPRILCPPNAFQEEVEATKNHVLETFYPISPTMGLQECNVYDVNDDTGFHFVCVCVCVCVYLTSSLFIHLLMDT